MAESLDSIYQNMKKYSTDELRAIWNEGDSGQWTPSTLEIVSLILRDRGAVLDDNLHGRVATAASEPAEVVPAVRAVDFRMPFSSMVIFMIKWTFASIPALVILGLVVVGVIIGLSAIGAPVPRLYM